MSYTQVDQTKYTFYKEAIMAYEFKKLADVEAVEQVPEGANMLIEDNGEVKRAPATSGSDGGYLVVTITGGVDGNHADKTIEEIVDASIIMPVIGVLNAENRILPLGHAYYNIELNNGSPNESPAIVPVFKFGLGSISYDYQTNSWITGEN